MKKLFFPFLFVACLLMVSCSDKDDSPIDKYNALFDVVEVSSPDNLILQFDSPDPGCGIPPLYWITLNQHANELVVECTNASDVEINIRQAFNEENADRLPTPIVGGQWWVEKVDSKTVKFVFNEVNVTESTPEYAAYELSIKAPADNDRGYVSSSFYIRRLMTYTEPLQ